MGPHVSIGPDPGSDDWVCDDCGAIGTAEALQAGTCPYEHPPYDAHEDEAIELD